MSPPWPDGARAAISITLDNLGEAAELELGLRDASAPLGDHYSVTIALPIVLALLADAGLQATFFIEGINAEVYPDALRAVLEADHELAYHAWCHEDWSTLSAAAEVANLDRGLAALREIGVEIQGLRPPGGRLNAGSCELLASRGLSYCSPAGSTSGIDRIAVLPFAWPAVDAFHVLPAFAALRAHLSDGAEPGGPDAIRASLLASIEAALADGANATLVLHTWMIELERDVLADVLVRLRHGVDRGELWVAPCRDVAAWMLEHASSFDSAPVVDRTSWTTPV
jgi:peptidoglycan/xylan/chitin deacetylase (PgdA/CDA1 family)